MANTGGDLGQLGELPDFIAKHPRFFSFDEDRVKLKIPASAASMAAAASSSSGEGQRANGAGRRVKTNRGSVAKCLPCKRTLAEI